MKLYNLILAVFTLIIFCACREEEDYMSLRIRNETSYLINCDLKVSDNTIAGHQDKLELMTGASSSIFTADEVTKDPVALFKSIYPELVVRLQDDNSTELHFRVNDDPEGYQLNPYKDTAEWNLIVTHDLIWSDDATVYNYEFTIREEYIIKE